MRCNMMNRWQPPAFRMTFANSRQAPEKCGVLFRDSANPEKSIQTLRFRNRVAANFATVARWAQRDGERVGMGFRKWPHGRSETRELALRGRSIVEFA